MKPLLLSFFILLSCFSFGQSASKTTLSFGEVPAHVVRFYPNPAITTINFEFLKDADKSLSLQIFNFVGKKVLEVPSISQKTSVDLSNFFRGVYIFQVRDKVGRIVESGKFQVVK